VLAGVEAAQPGDAPLDKWRARYDDVIGPATTLRPKLRGAAWPPLVKRVLEATDEPAPLREVLAGLAGAGGPTASEALRAIEILLAGKLLAWH
jgi:hypothetical protein